MFPSQAVALLDAVAATDKELVHMTGDHYFQDPPGARDEVADLIAAWVAAR